MLSKKLIETAVNWWAERVTGNTIHSNGDETKASEFAGLLADLMQEPVKDKNKVEKYKESLAEHLVKSFGDGRSRLCLSCDYAPDFILSKAAKEAEINVHNYPWKTSMIISDDRIEVSEGYGQPYRMIYFEG